MTDEVELVQQARAGELNSFNQLVEKYQEQVYNLSWRMLGNTQDAEDATQETFVLAWRAFRGLKGVTSRPGSCALPPTSALITFGLIGGIKLFP